ncbi:Ig-like domain-containing protein [Aliarcobacter cryaerophilus]|uniref:Ig-like domain-containing protein n=1 Tax=Aliarcobacter cryaerophilus TaxID=28198 RepID=UPI003DA3CAEF
MANLAQIQSIAQGQFFVKDSLGNLTELKVGDTVSLNDTIVAASSNTDLSKIEILFDTNELITLSQGEQLLDATLLASTFGNEELAFDKQEVDETLNAWNNAQDGDATDMETAAGDVTEQATNAGNEEAADGGALRSKFNSRDGSSTNVESDLIEPEANNIREIIIEQGAIDTSLLNPQLITENPVISTDNKAPVVDVTDVSVVDTNSPADGIANEVTVKGTSDEPNAEFTVKDKDGNTIGTGTTDSNGNFEITIQTDKVQAGNQVTVEVVDKAGNAGEDSGNAGDLKYTDNKAPVVDVTDVSVVDTNSPADGIANEVTVKGTSDEPNAEFTVKDKDGNTIGTGTTDSNGNFEITIQTDKVQAGNQVTVEVVDKAGNAGEDSGNAGDLKYTDNKAPVVDIIGSTVTESSSGTITGDKTVGTVTISFNKPLIEDLTVTLNNGQKVDFKAGETSKTVEVETSRVDDAYKQGVTKETISIVSTSDSEINIVDKKATITIDDDNDGVDVTVSATATTPKVINVNTKTDGTTGVKITAIGNDGKETNLSVIKGTDHDGFGVETKVTTTTGRGKNKETVTTSVEKSNGDTKELGFGEKIVVEFTDGKDVNSIDVSFAWRNNHETARVTFIKDGKVVGYAEVTGDGSSTTKAIVTYYTPEGEVLKVVNAKGSSDKVDELFTFELPSKNGGLESFDTVEFTAPKTVDDYLINSIVYREVLNTDITNIITDGGKITFNIQVDENYPPQGKAIATVEVNGEQYTVELNATGRGTLTIDAKDLGDLSKVDVKVISINGGNYEGINTDGSIKEFDFTSSVNGEKLESSDDIIAVREDTAYVLKVTDFGDVSPITKEFKITELPENGKLFLTVIKGETIIDQYGNKSVATEDTKVEVSKDQVISLADVGAGKVVFEPNTNSDVDGSFKFTVGNGSGSFSQEYTTTIDVKAVADAPTVSINITKSEDTASGNGSSSSNPTSTDFWSGYSAKGDIIETATYDKDEVNWNNNQGFTDGNDSVSVGTLNASIDTGAGDDNIYVSGNVNQSISAGDGNDNIFIEGSAGSSWTMNLGDGDNHLHIKGDVGLVTGGSGDDTVLVEGSTTNTLNLGDGNNELHIKGNSGSTVNTGDGNDKILVEGNAQNVINAGAGNDIVIVRGNTQNVVEMGAGNDYLEIGGKVLNTLYGGEGIDTLFLKDYTKADYDTNLDDLKWKIIGFENISFKDGNYEFKDGELVAKQEVTHKYDIVINASLVDTDGSEKLSDITLKNIPQGSILYNGEAKEANKLTANSDGSYTVKVDANGETKLSLTSESEISQDKLDGVQVSATSTDTPTDGQEASSKAISFDGSGDIDLSNLKNITEINLDNGKENKLSLTLDDVLKMSGDDNTIKISGDAFDKVALKGENDWTKSQSTITEDNKTFDVYSGSIGDQTVQVKVEQPISDGITN